MLNETAMLEEEQKRNLGFLEWYGRAMPTVRGVPVLLGMTYEAVQFFNMVALKAMELKEESSACLTNQ